MDNTLITNDRLETFKRNAHLIPPGIICEVGVYKGGSLKYLAELFPDRKVYGFDTFEGLPKEHWDEDEHHEPGDFGDTDIKSVAKFVNSKSVYLIQGLFPDSAPDPQIKDVALVHIDTDFYKSIAACIEYFVPRMAKGGLMIFDDYQWANCYGVERAIEEAGLPVIVSADYQAIYIHI